MFLAPPLRLLALALVLSLATATISAQVLRLSKVAEFRKPDLLDLSTGAPTPHIAVAPADLEFFPDGSGQSLLVLNTGLIAWLGPDFSLLGSFQVASANSLAQFRESGEFFDNEGLLGLAFDPDFAANGYVYVHLNPQPKQGVDIWRLRWNSADLAGIWAGRELVFSTDKLQVATSEAHLHNHNGGNPSFGPDGKLYVLMGDGGIGGFDYSRNQSQDPASFWGKVLRLDPAGEQPPQVLARGLRNPFTHAWLGDRLLIGDVAGDLGHQWEEINLSRPGVGPMPNYGWPILGGPCTDSGQAVDCAAFTDPIHGYRKDDSSFMAEDPQGSPPSPGAVNRSSIILGPVYQGGGYQGRLQDTLIYGDLLQGWIRGLRLDGQGQVLDDRHLLHHHEYIIGFAQGPDQQLYLLAGFGESSSIYRIEDATAGDPDAEPSDTPLVLKPTGPLPPTLSATGAFTDLASLTPMDRAWPYAPRYPLWTDGADKFRFLILPPGATIDTADPRRWVFPEGTLIFKHFSYSVNDDGGSRRRDVETRVLQKTAQGWRVGVYVWREDGLDAELSDGNPLTVTVRPADPALPETIAYPVPGHAQCLTCHDRLADFVIGVEAVQLNHAPPGQDNLLDQLAMAGSLSDTPKAPWPSIAGSDPQEQAVRGYLHGNCAHCHSQYGGLAGALGFGLDHQRTLEVVGKDSVRSEVVLVTPGSPGDSALLHMLRGEPGYARMPPLASSVPDQAAAAEVAAWIESLGQNRLAEQLAVYPTAPVVEYHNQPLDHYFMTANAAEIAKVDSGGAGPGWSRTGYTFKGWGPATPAPPESSPVCRFYGTPGLGPNSHFYTAAAAECDWLRAVDPGWTQDRVAAFQVLAPEGGGCGPGFDPVYRAYNDDFIHNNSNHRYTTSLSVHEAMVAAGWENEGVVMCVPR